MCLLYACVYMCVWEDWKNDDNWNWNLASDLANLEIKWVCVCVCVYAMADKCICFLFIL